MCIPGPSTRAWFTRRSSTLAEKSNSTTTQSTASRAGDFGHLCTGGEVVRKWADAESFPGEAMKRSFALLIVALFLLLGGCSRKEIPEAKRPEVQPQEVQSDEFPVKAETPDDPGSPGTVVVPLQVLEKQAKASLAKAPVPQKALPVDHSDYLEAGKPRSFLHKVFSLNKNVDFGFEIPPHQWNARLRGNFRSFTRRNAPDSTSDRTADVDVILLNEQDVN